MKIKRLPAAQGTREAMIIFTVSGFKFAIAAAAVREIRDMQGLEKFVPSNGVSRASKVESTLKRNGVTHFVVSAARHFRLPPAKVERVLILRQLAAGVMVDGTERMAEISVLHALPEAFQGDERRWYRGLALLGEEVVPVVDHTAFLTRGEVSIFKMALNEDESRKAAAV
ncbi:MAG TPA: chemotaxis protein CheW [Alphaproteobacteria bacterium]|nr:chemotaxis protein CheW [Alphaproteobacteria bacterium]